MFKRNQKSAADLAAQLQQMAGTQKFEKDPTEWTLTTDKAGNGAATIRFLPAKGENGEMVPFIKIYAHSYKDASGKWYIENCPTTLGQSDGCPVCAANKELWDSGTEENKKIVSLRKRKLSYWANIVVIKDEANPEAVGKNFKFRFGQKIFEKINVAASPTIEEIKPIDVTDVFEGANFYLKVKQVAGYANYDDSTFGPQSELFNGDEAKLEKVWNGMHSLSKIIAPSEFKSQADLEKAFARASGSAARRESSVEREVREARETKVHQNPAPSVAQTDDLPWDDEPKSTAATGGETDAGDDLDAFLASLN